MNLTDFRTLGRTGLRVSPVCLGTMPFGDPDTGADDDTSATLLDRYIEAGGNFLDTANAYGNGRSEQALGTYLRRRRELRDRLVISSKFAIAMHPGDPNSGGSGRKAIRMHVEDSLRRLQTDYLDIYWQHNWDRHTPLEETISTLDDLVRSGKIRYIGLSDTPAWVVARMATIAEFRGWSNVAAIQVEYSLLERTAEGELFGVAAGLGLGVLPWSPLASGVLSGKYSRTDQDPAGSARRMFAAPYLTDRSFDIIDVVTRISGELGVSVAATALAWIRQQPQVTSTIIGARTLAQLDANLASLDVTLAPVQLAELSAISAPSLNFPAEFLRNHGFPGQQAGTTINGLPVPART